MSPRYYEQELKRLRVIELSMMRWIDWAIQHGTPCLWAELKEKYGLTKRAGDKK